MDRIDLSTVPSAMEELARQWGASVTWPPRATPRRVPLKAALPPRPYRAPRPFADKTDKGCPGFYGADPALVGIDRDEKGETIEKRARADAMKAIARDLPDPAHYARYMPADEATELLAAERGPETWRFRADIPAEVFRRMQSVGLAYLGANRNLPVFTQAVRKILLEDEAKG